VQCQLRFGYRKLKGERGRPTASSELCPISPSLLDDLICNWFTIPRTNGQGMAIRAGVETKTEEFPKTGTPSANASRLLGDGDPATRSYRVLSRLGSRRSVFSAIPGQYPQ